MAPKNTTARTRGRVAFDRGWLPTPLTRFVGREEVLGTLVDMMPPARLVTVTGPAGCGKTRLAREAAALLWARFPGGAHWVDLSQIQDPALVPHQIAMSVGIPPGSGDDLVANIAEWSRQNPILVVTDSCEHVIDVATSLLGEVLEGCPGFYCLATSRELLGIRGEQVVQVLPMTLPPPHSENRTEILRAESVQLFLDRVRDVMPTYDVSDGDAPSIAAICRRLDGIPLALELAAARLPVLGAVNLLDRLHDRLGLLKSQGRTAIPRHRTMRAAIDWSYGSLSEAERTLFGRLSVFVGGFDLSSVEDVCSGEGLERGQILDLLTTLVGKSLVQVGEHPHAIRYTLLELLGQYVEERLVEAGTAARFRRRHAEHFVRMAALAESHQHTAARTSWTERLALDLANVRATLAWTHTQSPLEHARFVASLAWFWSATEQWEEGLEWLEQALSTEGLGDETQSKISLGIGLMRERPGHSSTNSRGSSKRLGLDVRALGPLEVAVDGVQLPTTAWSHARPRELLVYLLCHPNGFPRGKIGQDFWPDRSPDKVKNNFHVALHFLRRALGRPDWIVFDGARYHLAADSNLRFDMHDFEVQIGTALHGAALPKAERERQFEQALALYRGDLLASEPVGTWVSEHRDRTRSLYVKGLWALAELLFTDDRYEEVVDLLRRLVATDELHEGAVRMLMVSLARLGERASAIRQFDRLSSALERDLSAKPEPETVLLNERLLRADPV